jgi:hypothetical protein
MSKELLLRTSMILKLVLGVTSLVKGMIFGTDQIMGIRVPIDIVPSSLARLNCSYIFTVFSFLVDSVTWRKTKYCQPIINRLSR